MKIKIENIKLENIDYRDLKPLQGDLKILTASNYNKLKKSFTEKNMFAPTFVWRKAKDEIYLIDGHGRKRLLDKEKAVFIDSDGKETYKIPCVVIDAKDEKDAKEKLLVITSQFQTITPEGIEAFAVDINEDWIRNTTSFDAFNIPEQTIEDKIEDTVKNLNLDSQFLIVIECINESEQENLYSEFMGRGLKCKIIT